MYSIEKECGMKKCRILFSVPAYILIGQGVKR